ncbi:deoxyribonuclease IV [Geobacter pickeringii]|uniref:Probable endonuclease 4 n=1 Tax=Geobacter pickeringii TaxID=345632 RepID=A0A0B5BJK4_9BACT|nr:deoxyribonuclease IV [Geobacter pickeringii]AJE04266.1 endonuclease IV [Geobacter pickeringii]
MNDYFGAHMSIAGGLHNAPGRGVKTGCGVIQIFTQNSNQWRGKIPSDSDVALFREQWEESGLHEIVCHDIYLINLAAAPGEVREKSLAAFREEMERCARLGITKIVMHPGSHLGEGEETGIKRICAAFDELFAAAPDFTGKVLLETTAGQGSNLGYTFEHLRAIIDGTAFSDRFGVCYDTCHTFAAGYDITSREGYDRVFAEFDRIIGIDRLQCFHVNDSKKGLNCRIDRHEHIGQGAMGLDGFRFLVNDPRFAKIPKVLETPKGDDDEFDIMNLKTLREMVGR